MGARQGRLDRGLAPVKVRARAWSWRCRSARRRHGRRRGAARRPLGRDPETVRHAGLAGQVAAEPADLRAAEGVVQRAARVGDQRIRRLPGGVGRSVALQGDTPRVGWRPVSTALHPCTRLGAERPESRDTAERCHETAVPHVCAGSTFGTRTVLSHQYARTSGMCFWSSSWTGAPDRRRSARRGLMQERCDSSMSSSASSQRPRICKESQNRDSCTGL